MTVWEAPEPVDGPAPGVTFASPGDRFVAFIVDVVVIGVVCLTISFVGGVVGFLVPVVWALAAIAISVIPVGYLPWFWWQGGQTPGMKLMRIKVVRDRDGQRASGGQAVTRLIGFWVSILAFGIGFIWIFIDERRRGWPDLLAKTIVITSDHL